MATTTHIHAAAERLAAEVHENHSWHVREFQSPLDDLIVYTVRHILLKHIPMENPSLDAYLAAANMIVARIEELKASHDTPAELIEVLWLRRIGADTDSAPISYTYDNHYGVYLDFHSEDMLVDVEDQDRDYTWSNESKSHSGIAQFCHAIYDRLDFITQVFQNLPRGYIEDFGGRTGVIQTFWNAEELKHLSQKR